MTTADLLDFLLRFSSRHHFLVWRQIFFVFAKVQQAFLFSSPQIRTALQNLHMHLVISHSPDEVWNISSRDPIPVQNAKALFYAQGARYDHLKTVSVKLFDEFMAGNEKALNPNIRKHVFHAVINDRVSADLVV